MCTTEGPTRSTASVTAVEYASSNGASNVFELTFSWRCSRWRAVSASESVCPIKEGKCPTFSKFMLDRCGSIFWGFRRLNSPIRAIAQANGRLCCHDGKQREASQQRSLVGPVAGGSWGLKQWVDLSRFSSEHRPLDQPRAASSRLGVCAAGPLACVRAANRLQGKNCRHNRGDSLARFLDRGRRVFLGCAKTATLCGRPGGRAARAGFHFAR